MHQRKRSGEGTCTLSWDVGLWWGRVAFTCHLTAQNSPFISPPLLPNCALKETAKERGGRNQCGRIHISIVWGKQQLPKSNSSNQASPIKVRISVGRYWNDMERHSLRHSSRGVQLTLCGPNLHTAMAIGAGGLSDFKEDRGETILKWGSKSLHPSSLSQTACDQLNLLQTRFPGLEQLAHWCVH